MIDTQCFDEVRRRGDHPGFKTVEPDLNRTRLDPCPIKYVLESNTGPQCIAHRAVAPLSACHTWIEEAARISRTLVHCSHLYVWKVAHDLTEAQREFALDHPTDHQTEARAIDVGRDTGQMPAHEEAIVRREHTIVEHGERCLEQGGA